MDASQPRLTLTEAMLVFLAVIAGLFTAGGILYALLGVWALPIVQVLFVAGPVLMACRGRGPFRLAPRLLGIAPISARVALGAALVGASFWYLEIRALVPIAERWLGGEETSEAIQQTLFTDDVPIGVLILMVSLLPGACEELLFRGALLRAFRPRLGATRAVLLSATLFAGIHVYPAQMLPTFALGLVLGAFALRTGSVVTAMIVHVIHNATVVAVSQQAWPELTEALDANPTATLIGAATATTLGFLLVLAPGSARNRRPEHGNHVSS